MTGGAGYVGHVLVPRLLHDGYNVTVYDTLWYGCRLPNDPCLRVVQGDIRHTESLATLMPEHDAVLHLACVSNDASFELDPALSESINYACFEPLVLAAKRGGIRRFIYCSSSSVYGVSDAPDVTEDHPLVPLTLYNKFKGMCEPLALKHASREFTVTVIRPATLCGYSPRQRLDLSVNILTNHALTKGVITVNGGAQMRPNLHIDDMVRAYQLLLQTPSSKIQGQIFNIGADNYTIAQLAKFVAAIVPAEVRTVPSTDDQRSYHVNSDKIRRKIGFAPVYSVAEAINDISRAYANHLLPDSMDDDRYYNVRTMKKLGVK